LTLEINELTRTLSERTLFSGLSFRVSAGESLVIRGPSGSGKTLLLRAIAGLDPLEAGSITWEDKTPTQHGWPRWRRMIGYLPQQPVAPGGTPDDLISTLRGLAQQRDAEWDDPKEIGAALALPAECWSRPWARASGGERQRLHLAILMASRPAVLLLDEPTSALDSEAVARVETLIAEKTALWVTHDDAQAARVARRVVELAA